MLVDVGMFGVRPKTIIVEGTYSEDARDEIRNRLGIPDEHYYFTFNGKIFAGELDSSDRLVAVPKLSGGKGGFGSMLRAIGAQIEKTTNREACRDLSGRRLRDINEEQRLKKWIGQKGEREREAEERRKKRIEKLTAEPGHEFKDEAYDNERSELTEKVSDSLEQGLRASTSTKRKSSDPQDLPEKDKNKKKKKKKTFLDPDSDLSSSDSGSDNETKNDPETK